MKTIRYKRVLNAYLYMFKLYVSINYMYLKLYLKLYIIICKLHVIFESLLTQYFRI